MSLEFAIRCAAAVVAEVKEPGVTVLPFLHPGISTYFAVPLLEARRSLETQRLSNRYLAAVGETLQGEKGKHGQQDFRPVLNQLMDSILNKTQSAT